MDTDPSQLQLITDQAIDAAGAFASPDWASEAFLIIKHLCRLGEPFTSDQIWMKLKDSNLRTPEPRAMGSIVRSAAKEGWIISTGEYRKSIRPESHRRPVLVWRPV